MGAGGVRIPITSESTDEIARGKTHSKNLFVGLNSASLRKTKKARRSMKVKTVETMKREVRGKAAPPKMSTRASTTISPSAIAAGLTSLYDESAGLMRSVMREFDDCSVALLRIRSYRSRARQAGSDALKNTAAESVRLALASSSALAFALAPERKIEPLGKLNHGGTKVAFCSCVAPRSSDAASGAADRLFACGTSVQDEETSKNNEKSATTMSRSVDIFSRNPVGFQIQNIPFSVDVSSRKLE